MFLVATCTYVLAEIEGVTVPHAALMRLVRENADPTAVDRSEGEIAGYRNVLNLIHERHAHMELSPNLLLQLHRDSFRFTSGSGGQWKNVDHSITERRPDGSIFVRFQPTPAWRTPEAIDLLHRAFAEAVAQGVADPLILIALYILDFLCIHPFADGNGRIARLVTVLLLYRAPNCTSVAQAPASTRFATYSAPSVKRGAWK